MKKQYKRMLSLFLAMFVFIALFVPAASAQTRFSDVSGHWAHTVIEKLTEQGVVSGYPDGTVKPDRTITQGEYASLLVHAAGLAESEGNKGEPWAQKYANTLLNEGVLDSAADFSADEPITRLSIVLWTLRAVGIEQSELENAGPCKFPDTDGLTEEEISYLQVAADSGLLCGYPDGTARPNSLCTRSEAFTIIAKYDLAKEYVDGLTSPPVFSGTDTQQMSVSLEAPKSAVTYSPVEIKVHSKNVERMEWTIIGNGLDSAREAPSWDDSLNEQGGTVTFFEPGHYDLQATAFSLTGQQGEYILSMDVAQTPIRLTTLDEVGVYCDLQIQADIRSDVTDFSWSVTRNGDAYPYEYLPNQFDSSAIVVFFEEDGLYDLTLSGLDGLGNPVSGSCSVLAYHAVSGYLRSPWVAFVGEETFVASSDINYHETYQYEWQVLENGSQVDWDTVLDREFDDYNGGTVTFLRTGEFRIRLKVTEQYGHVTNLEVPVKVYEPVDFSIEMPDASYEGETVRITTTGLDASYDPVEWTVTSMTGGRGFAIKGDDPADYSGCSYVFTKTGEYQVTLTVPHEGGINLTKNRSIRIYPVVSVGLTMQDSSYVGDEVSVQGNYDNNMNGLLPSWELEFNGQPVDAAEYISGGFEEGYVCFLKAGEYTVTTSVTDDLGRIFSASRKILVQEKPYIPEPIFTAPPVEYIGREFFIYFEEDMGNYTVRWTYCKDGVEEAEPEWITGRLGTDGGSISCMKQGVYSFTATISDDFGQEKSHTEQVTVKPVPYIRMNPLDKATNEERVDYVRYLPLGSSISTYPDFFNTDGMEVVFELLEDGEIVYLDAEYFSSEAGKYHFQPIRTGNFVVRATVTDDYGNSFAFSTRIMVVPHVAAEITECPKTSYTGWDVPIGTKLHNFTNETVVWSLSYLSDEEAAPYLDSGADLLWYVAKGWEEKDLEPYGGGSLTNDGGTLNFSEPGYYYLRAIVTDQYNNTTENGVLIHISLNC